MEVLCEVLNTKYLTKDYLSELEFLFSHVVSGQMCTEEIYAKNVKDAINRAVASKELCLDLADCRFVASMRDILFVYANRYSDIITLRDTADSERDRFLVTQRQEHLNKNVAQRKLPPKPINIERLVGWVEDLDPEVIYDAHDYDNYPEFILLIQLMRPSIRTISAYRKMFDYAKDVFSLVLLEESEDYLYIPSGVDEFWDAHVNENNDVYVINMGYLPRAEFIAKYPCMPAEIGSKQFVYDLASPAWRDGMRQVLVKVKNFLAERPTTIATYFPEEFDDN